jgi:hypothetical protein
MPSRRTPVATFCLIDGAEFLDAAGEAIEIDGADPAAFGEHAVEHRDIRV